MILQRAVSFFKEKDEPALSIPFLCKYIVLFIIIGVVARTAVGLLMTYVFDIYHWGVIVQNINSGNGLYEITGYFYTPGWSYIIGAGAFFQDLFGIDLIGVHFTEALRLEDITGHYTSTITSIGFNMSLKILFLISDLVVGYLIFWLIRDITRDKRKAIIGFGLWFLCPLVIAIGSVIGMFDTFSVMMLLLSIILLRRGNYLSSGIMLCMATLVKFFPGFLIFIFIAYIISKHADDGQRNKKLLLFIGGIVATALIMMLPQILDGTIADCFLFITSRLSNGIGVGILDTIAGYAAVALYIVALTVSAICAMRMIKSPKTELDSGFLDMTLIIVTVLFLYPPLPQYVLLLLPFLIIPLLNNRKYLLPYCLLAIGTTVSVFAGGPADLVSLAAFTDLLDLESLMQMVEGYAFSGSGISSMSIIGFAGLATQYAGILMVLWARFGDRLKKEIAKRKVSDQKV